MTTGPDDNETRARVVRGWRAIAVLAAAVLVPVAAGLALWNAAETRQLVPGLDGCRFVRDREAQLSCVTDAFGDRVDETGRDAALESVDRDARASEAIGADCHLGWHPIGEAAGRSDARADRDYDNIDAASTCQQGYAHGYTIGFLDEREPTVDELARMVEADCGASAGLNALFNCTHAYGHVIARQNDGDPTAGIAACGRVDYTKLPGTSVASPVPGERPPVLVGAEHQCLYGLYMEISLLDVAAGGDRLDNCDTATNAEARKACYAYLPSRVNAITGSLEQAAKSCHQLAPEGDLRDSCVKTFSIGLQRREHCSMLVTRVEREACLDMFDVRDSQDVQLQFADGDPDEFDANVRIAPEPGVDEPDAPPAVGGAPPS